MRGRACGFGSYTHKGVTESQHTRIRAHSPAEGRVGACNGGEGARVQGWVGTRDEGQAVTGAPTGAGAMCKSGCGCKGPWAGSLGFVSPEFLAVAQLR